MGCEDYVSSCTLCHETRDSFARIGYIFGRCKNRTLSHCLIRLKGTLQLLVARNRAGLTSSVYLFRDCKGFVGNLSAHPRQRHNQLHHPRLPMFSVSISHDNTVKRINPLWFAQQDMVPGLVISVKNCTERTSTNISSSPQLLFPKVVATTHTPSTRPYFKRRGTSTFTVVQYPSVVIASALHTDRGRLEFHR